VLRAGGEGRRGGIVLQPDLTIRAARASEHGALAALLEASGLPASDLRASRVALLVAERDGAIAGVVGLERHGDAALLRSLAVFAGVRARGTGTALVRAVEAYAADQGVRELVLLTETAEPFFERRGYVRIARADAPAGLQTTSEFRRLCPASAVCMRKTISPATGTGGAGSGAPA
jgi:amino-acid N-acetyltransferase